jgi:hypothetical protein
MDSRNHLAQMKWKVAQTNRFAVAASVCPRLLAASSAAGRPVDKISVKLRFPKKVPFLHVDARTGHYAGAE